MSRRLLKSILIALILVVGMLGQIAAAPPRAVMCEFDGEISPLEIVVAGFDDMRGAMHQCLFFWNGRPTSVEK